MLFTEIEIEWELSAYWAGVDNSNGNMRSLEQIFAFIFNCWELYKQNDKSNLPVPCDTQCYASLNGVGLWWKDTNQQYCSDQVVWNGCIVI